jgi:hypothetical protein
MILGDDGDYRTEKRLGTGRLLIARRKGYEHSNSYKDSNFFGC